MAFRFSELIFSIASDGEGGARLRLDGEDEGTRPVGMELDIDCGRTSPPVIPGRTPLNRLEDLRRVVEDLEREIERQAREHQKEKDG